MASIYSTQLANIQYTASGIYTAYTVPANHLVVLTSVDMLQEYSAANQASYVVIGAALLLFNSSSGASFLMQTWTGKQVLKAGQVLGVAVPGSGAYFAATGYLLTTS